MTHAARYLTKRHTPADVRSVFAGLRPLVKQGDAAKTAALSRDHTIVVSESGLLTVTGGKWTTYRKMAEDVIDQAEIIAGLEGKPCSTENHPIHGWTDETIEDEHWRVYGADAGSVKSTFAEDTDLAQPLHHSLPYQKREVIWQTRHEMARTVEDVLSRRTRMLFLNANAAIEVAPIVASLMARELSQDANWETRQVQEFRELAQGYVMQS